jgi:hypothetical protein
VNDHEFDRFEAELRGIAPAPLPEHLMERLETAMAGREPARRTLPQAAVEKLRWVGFLRWLAPAMAMAAVGFLVVRVNSARDGSLMKQSLAAASGFRADDVQVDEELVSSFDVVGMLPGGEPVRFRCRQWRDQLVVTDKNHGVKIERRNPRIEVVPVRFETY